MQFLLRTSVAVLLSLAPLLFVIVQQLALRRQQSVLGTLPDRLRATMAYQDALVVLDRRYFLNGVRLTDQPILGWFWPMLAFWSSLGLVALLMFTSWSFALGEPFGIDWYVARQNLFLSGAPSHMTPDGLSGFQTDTLGVSCVAFEVAYVVILFRILMRLNVNEYNSLENLSDAVHLICAIIVATVATILLDKAGVGAPSTLTFFFAAGAGLRPDFYLSSLGQAAFATITAPGGPFSGLRDIERPKSPSDGPPTEIPLTFLDGVREDVAGRLNRMGVTTCHRLASTNVLVVWGRIPCSLPEVVDWVGQAILANQCPDAFKALRGLQVRTVQDLLGRLEAANEDVWSALGVVATDHAVFRAALESRPEVAQLADFANALREVAKEPKREAGSDEAPV